MNTRTHLILCLTFSIAIFPVVNAETINITGAVWCPNNCYPDDDKPGIMLEIVTEVFNRMDRELSYTEKPWSRAVLETRQGDYDALIGPSRFDVPDFIFPEEPIAVARNCFFTRAGDNWKYQGITSIDAITLGIGREESVSNEIDNYVTSNEKRNTIVVSGSNYLDKLLIMLVSNRISAVIADENVFKYLLSRTDRTEEIQNAGCMQKSLSIYLAFSPTKYSYSSKVIHQFNDVYRELKTAGKINQILERYNATSW